VQVTRRPALAGLCAALIACTSVLAGASPAHAFVYWANGDATAIGRSSLDGTDAVDNQYADVGVEACSVVTHDGYVYYGGSLLGSSIGRVPIVGGSPETNLIQGVTDPCGLAIYGNYIYWTNDPPYYSNASGSIGRASLTGPLDVHQDFITDPAGSAGPVDQPCGLTVNANGIYWANGADGTIGHANLDGSGQGTLLPNADAGCSITQAGPLLFWETASRYDLSPDGNTIAVSLLDGSHADTVWGTNLGSPCGLASFSHYLYFGASGGVIDRIDIDAASLQASETQLAQGQAGQCGVAVDGLFQAKLEVARSRPLHGGRVMLTATVSNPGRVTVRAASGSKPLLKAASATTTHAGRITMRLSPTALGRRELLSQRRLLEPVVVSYSSADGVASPVTRTVTLAR
jgi:hypothetical protein